MRIKTNTFGKLIGYRRKVQITADTDADGYLIFFILHFAQFFHRLVIEWRFVSRVKEQMSSFLDGFGSICPLALLKIFDENELELLMCGIQNIDVKDWKKNTLYKGDYFANHIIIQWFWRVRIV